MFLQGKSIFRRVILSSYLHCCELTRHLTINWDQMYAVLPGQAEGPKEPASHHEVQRVGLQYINVVPVSHGCRPYIQDQNLWSFYLDHRSHQRPNFLTSVLTRER